MIVAALDIATTMGVAIGAPRARPEYHTVSLGTGDMGERFAVLFRTIVGLVQQRGVSRIAVEAPILAVNSLKSAGAARFLIGSVGVAHAAAAHAGVPCTEIAAPTVRKHFLGYCPRGRDASKKAVMDRCRLLGWEPGNDNEADALALLDYALAKASPMHGASGAALFAAGGR